ncbi:MAG: hypothetical protein L3J69_12965, partial [Desulfobacula sp.]|nr:hypothetical protein [Desulfobacula sp.]
MLNPDVKMPVIGVFQGTADKVMNIKDLSTDILKTIPEYIASLNHKEGAKSANTYARTMQDVLSRNEIDKTPVLKIFRETECLSKKKIMAM